MNPSLSLNNGAYGWFSQSIMARYFSNGFASLVAFPDFQNLALYQFGFSMLTASRMVEPSLVFRVLCIFLLCAKEKVIWIYANPIIAFVAYTKTLCNISVGKKPHQSTGENRFEIYHQVSIPIGILCAFPIPAFFFVSNFKLRLQSGFKRKMGGVDLYVFKCGSYLNHCINDIRLNHLIK